jgi:hypothetical protein
MTHKVMVKGPLSDHLKTNAQWNVKHREEILKLLECMSKRVWGNQGV